MSASTRAERTCESHPPLDTTQTVQRAPLRRVRGNWAGVNMESANRTGAVPHLLAGLPHGRHVDLAHGEAVKAAAGVDDALDLVAARDVLVALVADVQRGLERRGVRLAEDGLVLVVELLVHGGDALARDDAGDGAGDALHRVAEGVLGAHALLGVAAEEGLHHGVHAAQDAAALAVDVGLVLRLQGGGEGERSADGDGPSDGNVGGAAVKVLVDGEGGVDAGAVDLLALHVQVAHGGAHALGRDQHHVDVGAELSALVLHHAEQEAVRQAQGGAGLHGGQDARVQLGLGSVGDEQNDHVAVGDDVKDLAQGALLLGEVALLRLGRAGRAGAQANADLNVHARLRERLAHVLRLRGRLGAPADDADLLDAGERLRQRGELVAAAADDVLLGVGKLGQLLLKHLGVEVDLDGGEGGEARGTAGGAAQAGARRQQGGGGAAWPQADAAGRGSGQGGTRHGHGRHRDGGRD
mmetsp:Transcript_25254/g.63637  ORF Transcript_25254/g.63637 Transcript_25254/m.63637 type:complete len:468 (+) Transcript_25254:613-2016(+)